MAKVFEAKYYTRECLVCFEPIEPGDDVCFEDDELVHADCADDPDWG